MSIYVRTIIDKDVVIIEPVEDHIWEYINHKITTYESVDSITILLYFEGYELELMIYRNYEDV